MKKPSTKTNIDKILIGGGAISILGFIVLIINAIDLYIKLRSCTHSYLCTVSGNVLIDHIGVVLAYSGLVIIGVGVVSYVIKTKYKK